MTISLFFLDFNLSPDLSYIQATWQCHWWFLSYLALNNKVHNSITQIMKLSANLLSISWSYTSAPVHLVASLHFFYALWDKSVYMKKYTNRNASHPVLLQSGTSNYKNLKVLNQQSATVTWSIYGPVRAALTAYENRWSLECSNDATDFLSGPIPRKVPASIGDTDPILILCTKI